MKTKDWQIELQIPEMIRNNFSLEKCYKEPLNFVWKNENFDFTTNRNKVQLIEIVRSTYHFGAWFNLAQFQIYENTKTKTIQITQRGHFVNEHKQKN